MLHGRERVALELRVGGALHARIHDLAAFVHREDHVDGRRRALAQLRVDRCRGLVDDARLLVEFVEQFRHGRNVPLHEAVVEAGFVRMRPILMTTLTSMVGSMPLALGIGEGSELMRPLAIAVVGGIAFSTMLTLFVVPCAYVVLHTAADRVRGFLLAPRTVPERAEIGD